MAHKKSSSNDQIFLRDRLIERMMGDEEVIVEILEEFVASTAEAINFINNKINQQKISDLEIEVHSLKGAAKNVEAHLLADALSQLEQNIKSANFIQLNQSLKQVEDEFLKFCNYIQ